ncbi:MAG: transporter substrate-binding protein, partial [Clostridia bacterium]|nr:transporter substrate-binding protein [Clostridia bacterium]
MSTVSWAYPTGAKEFYGFNPDKALECFKAAGYEQVDGKLVKDGNQLRIEVALSGDGTMDHPSAPVLTKMKEEMGKLGAELAINDCDGTVLWNTLYAGGWDMWVAAWGATIDPDMYQTYHSEGPSNHYKIKNEELDKLIMEARQTNDVKIRQEKYFRALDIMMEEAVEMPVYQRKNMYIFNPAVIDINTLPKDMSPYYGYFAEIENLRTVAQTQEANASEVTE